MLFAIIVVILAVIIVSAILISIFASKETPHETLGEQGENTVARVLGETEIGKQYVINDLLLSNDDGKSFQVDHIFINSNGIWVIETKNYAGIIFGEENQREWTQVMAYGGEKHKFYNPIKQNATHIYHLSKLLNIKNIFMNVVVFLSRADISNLMFDEVYSIDELYSIKNESTGISLSVEQMEKYYNKLIELKNSSTISQAEHIENIHKMQAQLQSGICPRCGGKLVLRDGKYGKFYGCSNYPNCKFTKDIE